MKTLRTIFSLLLGLVLCCFSFSLSYAFEIGHGSPISDYEYDGFYYNRGIPYQEPSFGEYTWNMLTSPYNLVLILPILLALLLILLFGIFSLRDHPTAKKGLLISIGILIGTLLPFLVILVQNLW